MTDLKEFYDKFPNKRQIGFFTEEELDALQDKLPEDIIEFLRIEGKCTFGDDFLWTVLPADYREMMQEWGLEKQAFDDEDDEQANPDESYAFLRTSFGTLFYYYKDTFYCFSPFKGKNSVVSSSFENLVTNVLIDDYNLNKFYGFDMHQKARATLQNLKEDEIFAIDPPIEKKGSKGTSVLHVVNMKDHLALLAKLYKHKVKE